MTSYRPGSAHDALERIRGGTDPWVAIGDLLDDRRRGDVADRERMIAAPLVQVDQESVPRWAALIAAAIDELCWESRPRIAPPERVCDEAYVLPEPGFLLPGWRLRMHQLVDTPAAFKRRDVYGGDRILSRV